MPEKRLATLISCASGDSPLSVHVARENRRLANCILDSCEEAAQQVCGAVRPASAFRIPKRRRHATRFFEGPPRRVRRAPDSLRPSPPRSLVGSLEPSHSGMPHDRAKSTRGQTLRPVASGIPDRARPEGPADVGGNGNLHDGASAARPVRAWYPCREPPTSWLSAFREERCRPCFPLSWSRSFPPRSMPGGAALFSSFFAIIPPAFVGT